VNKLKTNFLVKEKSRSKSTALSTVNSNSLSMFIMPPKNIVLIVQNGW